MIGSILEYGFISLALIIAWLMSLFFAQYDEKENEYKLFLWIPPCGIAFFTYRITRAVFLATFFDDERF